MPAFSLAYTAVHRVLSKRVEELLDRRPELALVILDDGAFVQNITAKALPPWPFDT